MPHHPSTGTDRYHTQVVIVGVGLAGLVTARELLDRGCRVLIVDKGPAADCGGLARESFGGILLVDTPQQRRGGIHDTPELALRDWESYAEFGDEDDWPRRWARHYCEHSIESIYTFLRGLGVNFLPVVNWPERGWERPGNSVPRWHIAWGLGGEIVERLWASLTAHPHQDKLTLCFEHDVTGLEVQDGRVCGVYGRDQAAQRDFQVTAEHVVIAAGGICGGDLSSVRANWYKPWGEPPKKLLNGAHRHADGRLHRLAGDAGANLTHLDYHWHYAAGVHHPRQMRPDDGLSLVPPRSALWFNALGERIGPPPLVGNTDTRHLVETILQQPGQYSWKVMNMRIARRELAVSGYDFMDAFRYKRRGELFWQLLFGNRKLVRRLLSDCEQDFVVADTPAALAQAMNERNLYGLKVDSERMLTDIRAYDEEIDRGQRFFSDAQLRQIAHARTYMGDRLRTCRFQKILDPAAGPLIAIREFILSRKSLGGYPNRSGLSDTGTRRHRNSRLLRRGRGGRFRRRRQQRQTFAGRHFSRRLHTHRAAVGAIHRWR